MIVNVKLDSMMTIKVSAKNVIKLVQVVKIFLLVINALFKM